MIWPEPSPGLVVNYAYLWKREARRGREEGVKDRPCVVVLVVRPVGDRWEVVVAPITHAEPRDAADALELPAATKRRLGLDEQRSWIVTTEVNSFLWPGPDLRPIRGGADTCVHGLLPRVVFLQLRDKIRARIQLEVTRRSQ